MAKRHRIFTDRRLYGSYREKLKHVIQSMPAHLLREEDMRATMRSVALESDEKGEFCSIARYLHEAPNHVDLRIQDELGRGAVQIEFKLWHSTLKDGGRHGPRSGSSSGLLPHMRDLAKLARLASHGGDDEYFFFSLAQSSRHPQAGVSTAIGWGPFLHAPREGEPAEGLLHEIYALEPNAARGFQIPHLPKTEHGDIACTIHLSDRWNVVSGGGDEWGCEVRFDAFYVTI